VAKRTRSLSTTTPALEPSTGADSSGDSDAREAKPLRGILLTVAGIGCITFNDALMKTVIDEYPVGQAIFVRGLFALLPIAWLVCRAGGWPALRIVRPSAQIWCALLLMGPIFLFMYSLSQLPLSTATIIFFTNPLFVTLLAPWLLRERVTWRRAITVSIGFAGAILVVDPGRAGFQWILLGPLMVALMSALRELVVRAALARETSVSLLFYSTTSVTVIAAFTLFLDDMPFGWKPLAPLELFALALTGSVFCLGIYLMTEGLRFADASLLALYKYTAILWALLLGFFVWNEVPNTFTWIGAGLIVASGLYTLRKDS
jgi:drug/metabolite transporter (DMT)-like permease